MQGQGQCVIDTGQAMASSEGNMTLKDNKTKMVRKYCPACPGQRGL